MARRKAQETPEVKEQVAMFQDKDIKALAYEKSIEVDRVYAALEDALSTAARKYYRTREPLEAVLDRSAGAVQIFAVKEIVENEDQIEDPQAQWTLDQARKVDPNAQIGGTIRLDHITKEVVDVVKDQNTQIRTYEAQKIDTEVEQGDEVKIPLTKPPDELGRIAAQSAKQVLYQKVREAEREKVFNEFKDKMGELENGYVKRFERGDMIIDLNGKTEGIIPRTTSRAPSATRRATASAVIVDVHTQRQGAADRAVAHRSALLIKLFEQEVPEIYDGTVMIRGAVREPGDRAKVAVYSRERDVDPVGACVGMKGTRVQSIIRELRGEKIDIHRQARPQRPPRGGADQREDRHQVRGRSERRSGRRAFRDAAGSDGGIPRSDRRSRDREHARRVGAAPRKRRLRRSRLGDQRLGRRSHRH
jgi:N utilization substance protein A